MKGERAVGITIIQLITPLLIWGQTFTVLPISETFAGAGSALGDIWSSSADQSEGKAERLNLRGTEWYFFGSGSDKGLAFYNSTSPATENHIEAKVHLNLEGATIVDLDFDVIDWGSGHGNDQLTVSLSNDGGDSFTDVQDIVLYQSPYSDGVWNSVNLDIHSLASSNSIALNDSFVVKLKANLEKGFDPTYPKQWDGQVIYIDNFSMTGNQTLPVDLSEFFYQSKTNELVWRTLTETDNEKFEIELSTDGIYYVKVGEVLGNGTTPYVNDYSFVIPEGHKNKKFARIKQVDFGGEYSRTKVIAIISDKSEEEQSFEAFVSKNRVTVTLPEKEEVMLVDVFSMNGGCVYSGTFYEMGTQVEVINSLKSGAYIVKCQYARKVCTKKIIIN